MTGRTCGRNRSENAGMSSESKVRIFTVENLRFPGEGSSAQGKSGPKPRTNVVGDGQQVEIPVPAWTNNHSSDTGGYVNPVDGRAGPSVESGGAVKYTPPLTARRDGDRK